MKPLVVIVGPTASGKTELSIKVAKRFNGECINADSTQIFKGTDIATNKITDEETFGIKQHLLSIKEVNENYSVADFQNDARNIIEQMFNENKLPIVVGGTGLYINALLMNYKFLKENHIPNFSSRFNKIENSELWKLLNEKDHDEAKKIHINNRYRIIRALEILEINNEKKSSINKNNKSFFYKNIIIVGLEPIRSQLYDKINNRVLYLVKKGLFDEIALAYKNCIYKNSQALKCIGGPEIIKYLNKEISYEESIELMQKNNRKYARRQLTWFKNQFNNVKWFNYTYDKFELVCEDVLEYLEKVFKR
ncbi:tRNA (adenosine(37)-N6)-dimethylallyltransferase MiaA [Spiroplasma turonicum]|uniref:tRNA dimethylallyltransferase n=1 Tax=Spiroplasma turonicum TaxID=216946 RepID=A0A0K1P5L1_9MOLU|nr:tRNA (adenosine(37)-N6)-dimethylallyltransferase MiaA [Spiroplasma turonicum]AKU79588.1 tRNA delta(2)-isopentenylpyrophosphate transferase [Spiroplasma turonicum]ALX70610.1 tRNA delta(2)-isopentenylpyrophosphate transferase [Spiroplasma turonicum]